MTRIENILCAGQRGEWSVLMFINSSEPASKIHSCYLEPQRQTTTPFNQQHIHENGKPACTTPFFTSGLTSCYLQSDAGPTDKQAGFLAALAKETGEKVQVDGMDRAEASSKIEDLLEKKNHGQTGAGAVVDRSNELKDDVSLLYG